MRGPERISEIIHLIERIWKAHPDLRFQQLMYILQSEFSKSNKDIGKIESVSDDGWTSIGFDFFNVEDNDFQEYLESSLDEGRWGKDV